ncbi:hypothetical protein Z043_121780, partial [Scleropages formosus]
MSATDGAGPAASALVAELSFSFQDELTATIHNAFGVAVEIAVLEVTKLVGQALRDVRDQMHETLRENRALQQRLRATELELSVARGRARDADKGSVKGEEEKEEDEVRRAPATNPALVEPGVAARLDVRERYDVAGGDGHAEAGARNSRSSFCEIREDGQVCSQDLSPDLEGESRKERGSVTATFTAAVSKGNQTCMYSNSQVETQVVSFEQVCSDMPSGVDAAVLVKVQSSLDMDLQNPKAEQPVRVKEELSDLGCTSASAPFVEAGEDFGPDCLSLAQSKLLEDWRPEPLHLQSCDTDPLIPCTSHSLCEYGPPETDSPVFNPDLPDLDIHTPSSSSLHPPFSKPFPPEESLSHPLYSTQRSSTNASVPNVSVPNSTGTHTCRVMRTDTTSQDRLLQLSMPSSWMGFQGARQDLQNWWDSGIREHCVYRRGCPTLSKQGFRIPEQEGHWGCDENRHHLTGPVAAALYAILMDGLPGGEAGPAE